MACLEFNVQTQSTGIDGAAIGVVGRITDPLEVGGQACVRGQRKVVIRFNQTLRAIVGQFSVTDKRSQIASGKIVAVRFRDIGVGDRQAEGIFLTSHGALLTGTPLETERSASEKW